MNALAKEKSPYLLQHRQNPVNWYPWGEEAFEKAKKEDKPIFLSIGYSTCHWCHVMAAESFEDEETARILNDSFVSVKVDREERPDIDAVYMKVCQAMTGSGGWPLTIFMTPEQKPVFAGTYFPKHSRYGRPGLCELAERVAFLWQNDRDQLEHAADGIASALTAQNPPRRVPHEELLTTAEETLLASFDPKWGGFGTAPKFPTPHDLLFLMARGERQAVDVTLKAMAKGGIFDQIGGGFSRYSTDDKWLIPHFEKMLYDNALLILAYQKSYEITGTPLYGDVVRRTAGYLLRTLRSPEGGFYAGQDADSEGVEGGYYTFSPVEVRNVLGDAEGEAFCRQYGISEQNGIPNLVGKEQAPWEEARLEKLYTYRAERKALHTDDKILLSWNGWAMLALTRCGQVGQAAAVCDFIETHMTGHDNRLFLRYCGGEAAVAGQLSDYAVYTLALLALYRATLRVDYLEAAVLRARQMRALFEDGDGGYFLTAHDAEKLIDRPKEIYDGAMPSGNAVAAMVLEVLAQLTGESDWREAADRQMRFMANVCGDLPSAHCFYLLALQMALRPMRLLVVCGDEIPGELLASPGDDLLVLHKSNANAARLAACAPFTADYPIPKSGVNGYLCAYGACRHASGDIASLLREASS